MGYPAKASSPPTERQYVELLLDDLILPLISLFSVYVNLADSANTRAEAAANEELNIDNSSFSGIEGLTGAEKAAMFASVACLGIAIILEIIRICLLKSVRKNYEIEIQPRWYFWFQFFLTGAQFMAILTDLIVFSVSESSPAKQWKDMLAIGIPLIAKFPSFIESLFVYFDHRHHHELWLTADGDDWKEEYAQRWKKYGKGCCCDGYWGGTSGAANFADRVMLIFLFLLKATSIAMTPYITIHDLGKRTVLMVVLVAFMAFFSVWFGVSKYKRWQNKWKQTDARDEVKIGSKETRGYKDLYDYLKLKNATLVQA